MLKKKILWVKKNKWQFSFYMALILAILWIVYAAFLWFKYWNYNRQLDLLNQDLNKLITQINNYKSKNHIRKYLLAKQLNSYLKPTKRSYIMDKLLKIYITINKMWSFKLENFNISLTDLSLNGVVKDLRIVYKSWGVLDQFQSLPFIQHIRVPVYTRQSDWYRFNLNAKILVSNGETQN